jgi:predicted Zn-dependent protease
VSWPVAAGANHIKAQFPSANGGILWMSGRMDYAGWVYVVSSNCNSNELAAYSEVKSSTTGKAEMRRWVDGIDMSRYRCDNVWDYYADVRISYMDQSNFRQPDGSYIGGRNIDVQASSAYCSFWGTSYPCGSRPNVQINQQKYSANSASYRETLLQHETGHSYGLDHHCTSAAVMNQGVSSCYGGRWGGPYFATDRAGIDRVYP